jgi:hypothetical protein
MPFEPAVNQPLVDHFLQVMLDVHVQRELGASGRAGVYSSTRDSSGRRAVSVRAR